MLPKATFRAHAGDFVVDEIPAYAPIGSGEHLHLVIKKTDLTTNEAVRRLARALDVDARGAGYAGMKDRHAITTQAITLPFPIARGEPPPPSSFAIDGIEVIETKRHVNKLKPGHLIGNRFAIRLRDVDAHASASIRSALEDVARRGAPNAFGPQRFGRDGDNPERALAWLGGKVKIRDRNEQRLMFSALQSLLFNRVLERRVEAGTWTTVLGGDIAKKTDSGGLFDVPLEGPERDDAVARAEAGAISATGPMFGSKMRWPNGEPLAMERSVLGEAIGDVTLLDEARHAGEGTRRPLRLLVSEMSVEDADNGLLVRFVLPKGGYATTVLGCACTLVDASRVATPSRDDQTEGD